MTTLLGIGTGRCGSMSLQRILNQCLELPDVITHEDRKLRQFPGRFTATANAAPKGMIYGDVAAYWLPHLYKVIKGLNGPLKLVLMVRNQEAFIQSLERKWGYNKFTVRPRTGWLKYIPYVQGKSIRDCAAKYWKNYNAEAITYDPFTLQTKDLNDDDKLTELYDYLGFTTRVYPSKRHYNGLGA